MIPEPEVSYISVIPSAREAWIDKPLNVLGGIRNDTDEEVGLSVTLWGRANTFWKELISQEIILTPREHKHLYFTIPANCLEPLFWDQEDLPEIELLTFHKKPDETAQGILIFVKKSD